MASKKVDSLVDIQNAFVELFSDKDIFPFPKKYQKLVAALVMDPDLEFITCISNMAPGCDMDSLSTAIYNVYSYMDEAVR